jgi:hypothetical protein
VFLLAKFLPMILPLPNREDFEKELKKLFPNGDQDTFVRYLRQKNTYISQMLNPEHERESIPYRFLEWLWARDAQATEKGDELLDLILLERGNWLAERIELPKDTKHLTKEIGTQYTELIDAEVNHDSIDKQIQEALDIVRAAEEKVKALRIKKALGNR